MPTDSPLHVALSVRAHSMPHLFTLCHAHSPVQHTPNSLCTHQHSARTAFTPSTCSRHQLHAAAVHSTHIHPHFTFSTLLAHSPCTLTAPCTTHAGYTLPLITHSLVLCTLPPHPMRAHSVLQTLLCTHEFTARAPCTPIHTPCTHLHFVHTHTVHTHPTLCIRPPQVTHTATLYAHPLHTHPTPRALTHAHGLLPCAHSSVSSHTHLAPRSPTSEHTTPAPLTPRSLPTHPSPSRTPHPGSPHALPRSVPAPPAPPAPSPPGCVRHAASPPRCHPLCPVLPPRAPVWTCRDSGFGR